MTRSECAAWLAEHDRFCILTHAQPDGDTLGSAALLCRGLRQLGKTAHVLENPETTPKYTDLCDGLTVSAPESWDTIVSVDVAAAYMFPENALGLPIDLRIDHHGGSVSFTPHELVDTGCAACGELILDVLEQMGAVLDIPMAIALYTAVSTDTGCFRYSNTNQNTFLTAAKCAATGADLFPVNRKLFETNSLGRLRLQGWLVENARFMKDGQIAVCALPKQVERELNLAEDDFENISGFPRTIEGVKISAMLRQHSESSVKLSIRTVPGYDAGALCAKFGGGGHKGAAGCVLHMSMDQALEVLINVLENY